MLGEGRMIPYIYMLSRKRKGYESSVFTVKTERQDLILTGL